MDETGTQGDHVALTGNGKELPPEEKCIKMPKEQEREADYRVNPASPENHQLLTDGEDSQPNECASFKCPAFRATSDPCDGRSPRDAGNFGGTDTTDARRWCATGCEVEIGGGEINHQRTEQMMTSAGSDGKMQKWSKQFRKKACIIKLDGCHYTIGILRIN